MLSLAALAASRCSRAGLVVLAAACAPFEPIDEVEPHVHRPAIGEDVGSIGNVRLIEDADDLEDAAGERSLVVTYRFTGTGVAVIGAQVVVGTGRVPRADGFDFRVVLVGGDGSLLAEYRLRDPRRLLVERRGIVEVPERDYVARLPFHAEAQEVRLLDRRGRVRARAEVGAVVREHCRRVPSDC